MKIVQTLISYGLRQVIGDMADKAVEAVVERFTDESAALPKAVSAANEHAWHALQVALAGDSYWEKFKRFALADATERALRQQIEAILRAIAITSKTQPEQVRSACLNELNHLRQSKAFKSSHFPIAELKRQTAAWKRYTDPKGLIDGAWDAVAAVANELEKDYAHLSHLLRQRVDDGPPLLAALFSFFLRQEIAKNSALSAAMTFDFVGNLYAAQENAFLEVEKTLAAFGDQIDAILDQLDRMETVGVQNRALLLDIQAEMQRNHDAVVQLLSVQVSERLDKQGMQRGVLSSRHSLSIHSEDERNVVRGLLHQLRQLPAEQQRQVPALLNGLGKLLVGAGDFAEARRTFSDAARIVPADAARAEIHYNDYRAAVEQRDWDGALTALQHATTLDPERFTFFPRHRYRPLRILGAGGFGTAFLCHDEHFDQQVVVKTLHADVMERSIKDVFNEAQVLRHLSDPAIITVRDGEFADPRDKKRPYIVMDYFPGVTLRAYVEKHGELTPKQYVEVAQQVVSGMRKAHRQGVLHRDLKPDNIMVLREGERFVVKIIDFGLAMRRQVVETSAAQPGAAQTVHGGSAVGTLAYSAPEQMGRLPGVQPGAYSDVFAFGKTGWFALFKTEWPATPNRRQLATIPHALADLLEKCTEYLPTDRYPDFEAVAQQYKGRKEQRKTTSKVTEEIPSVVAAKSQTVQVTVPPPSADSVRQADEMGKVWRVNPSGDGDYRTLEEAVAKSPAGAKILITGTHRLANPLILKKPLTLMGTLVGEGKESTSIIWDGEKYVVRFSADGLFSASDLTFIHEGDNSANVVQVDQGEVSLLRCRFVGGVFDEDNDHGGDGLHLGGGTRGQVEACEMIGNGRQGITVAEQARPTVEANICRDNKGSGIAYFGSAAGMARNNTCAGNECGICVGEQAQPTLEANICRENEGGGISYWGSTAGTARNNTCVGNSCGIGVSGQAQPALEANTCRENKEYGIGYSGSAGGTARNNTCASNETYGIYISQKAQPALEANTCRENKGSGIGYFVSAAGTARNNTCASNEEYGIVICKGYVNNPNPRLVDNRCAGNKLGDVKDQRSAVLLGRPFDSVSPGNKTGDAKDQRGNVNEKPNVATETASPYLPALSAPPGVTDSANHDRSTHPHLICPNCQKVLSVPTQCAGQVMKCPLCNGLFTVPALPLAAATKPQVEEAKAPPQPPKPSTRFTNSLGMEFVLAPAATFWMGERGQQRAFAIPHLFYIGVHPVTRSQWQTVMGDNPSWFSRGGQGADKVADISDADLKLFPVEQVSWKEVQQFIEELNAREQDREWVYRLPTEAEWEYVCRGGVTSQAECAFDFYFDQPTNDASSRQANFNGHSPAGGGARGPFLERPSKVGSYQANRLGVFDMHGNVWEWCLDVFDTGASDRVVRGGGWNDNGLGCRAASRFRLVPSYRDSSVGFRLARVPS